MLQLFKLITRKIQYSSNNNNNNNIYGLRMFLSSKSVILAQTLHTQTISNTHTHTHTQTLRTFHNANDFFPLCR